mmetsp:Transcript_68943/g.218007  ORF Transcript_68943/g.218007 Transcript_68943/m.218007 type:complete len:352 (-) Transcript_68943:99-1154(-)
MMTSLSTEHEAIMASPTDHATSVTLLLWERRLCRAFQFSTLGVSVLPKVAWPPPGRSSVMMIILSSEPDAMKRPSRDHLTTLTGPKWSTSVARIFGTSASPSSFLLSTGPIPHIRTLWSSPPVANLTPSGWMSRENIGPPWLTQSGLSTIMALSNQSSVTRHSNPRKQSPAPTHTRELLAADTRRQGEDPNDAFDLEGAAADPDMGARHDRLIVVEVLPEGGQVASGPRVEQEGGGRRGEGDSITTRLGEEGHFQGGNSSEVIRGHGIACCPPLAGTGNLGRWEHSVAVLPGQVELDDGGELNMVAKHLEVRAGRESTRRCPLDGSTESARLPAPPDRWSCRSRRSRVEGA